MYDRKSKQGVIKKGRYFYASMNKQLWIEAAYTYISMPLTNSGHDNHFYFIDLSRCLKLSIF